jgi:hypothetical protein
MTIGETLQGERVVVIRLATALTNRPATMTATFSGASARRDRNRHPDRSADRYGDNPATVDRPSVPVMRTVWASEACGEARVRVVCLNFRLFSVRMGRATDRDTYESAD